MGWSDSWIDKAITVLVVILWLGLIVGWLLGVPGMMPFGGWTAGGGLPLIIWRLWHSFWKNPTDA